MLGRLGVLSAVLTIVAFYLAMHPKMAPQSVWQPLACIGLGGIGAYVSRALAGRSDLPCDANAGRRLHREEALLRWVVGSSAAGLLYLLVRAEVVKIGDLNNGGFALCLALAFLAGMSERFLPSVLNRFNEQAAANPGVKPQV
jgi:hypothetical protein